MNPFIKKAQTEFSYYASRVAQRDGLHGVVEYTGEEQISADRRLMVSLARDQYQNNPIYKAIIDGMAAAILGEDGAQLMLAADLKAKYKAEIYSNFNKFFKLPEVSESMSFTELEREIVTQFLNVGEILLIKIKGGQLQIIESERIEEVNVNNYGKIENFKIYYQADRTSSKTKTIAAKDAIYICNRDRRASQVRGNGVLWCSLPSANMITVIMRSCAKSWGMVSRFAFSLVGQDAPSVLKNQLNQLSTDGTTTTETETEAPEDSVSTFDISDGMIFAAKNGYSLNPIKANTVPDKLADHLLTYLRFMLSPLRVDAASGVLSDFSKLNFSSSRAARQAFAEIARIMQSSLITQFYDRVFRWRVGAWLIDPKQNLIAKNDAETEQLLNAGNWILPAPQINSKEAAEEALIKISGGLEVYDEVLKASNKDPEEHVKLIAASIKRAIETAKQIEEETGVQVPFEVFCGRDVSKTKEAVKEGNAEDVKEGEEGEEAEQEEDGNSGTESDEDGTGESV